MQTFAELSLEKELLVKESALSAERKEITLFISREVIDSFDT